MADHPVPQDVEADDKLIGPFGFRQFVYLMIVGGLILLAVALWQIFPLLSIIPIPFAIFLLLMALPLKKDQPMETYMAALFHFYFRSHNRWWAPGQRETTILITAPKQEEEPFRSVSQEEASNRLSFLANVIDSEGEVVNNNMNSAFLADAANTQDMFDVDQRSGNLSSLLAKEDMERRNTINQIMNSNQPAAAPVAPVAPVMQPAPVTTNAPDPMADGILTPAEILTGGRSISSGDLANAPAASATFPAAPTTPIANAAPVMPPQPVYQPVIPQPVSAQYPQYYAQTPAQSVAPTPTTAPAPTQAPTPTQAPVPASDSARQQPQPQVAPQAGSQPSPTTPATNSPNSQKPDIIESSKVDTKSQTPTKKGDKEIYISLH